jgi:hypothetical protein
VESRESESVYKLEDGLGLVIYDLPTPPIKPPKEEKEGEEVVKIWKAWKRWYDEISTKLSKLGYKLQYSVTVVPVKEETLKEFESIRQYAIETLEKLWESDHLNLIPRKRPDIKLVQFKPSSPKDSELFVQLFKQYLFDSLKHLRDMLLAWVKEKPAEYVERKTREYLTKLREQDKLGLLDKDEELRKLLAEIDVLSIC